MRISYSHQHTGWVLTQNRTYSSYVYHVHADSRVASKHTKDQDYELQLVQALCWSRSFETETILIHVNPGGDRKDGGFMGGSGIWAPLKGKIGGYEREEVGVEFVDVELGVLQVCPL